MVSKKIIDEQKGKLPKSTNINLVVFPKSFFTLTLSINIVIDHIKKLAKL